MPWQLNYFRQGEEETWYAETYMGDSSASWQRALAAATRAGDVATFRRMHAIVGPHSRLYSVSWSGDDQRPLARIGWQLDRTLPADRALEAIGCTGAWPAAAAFWASLLGRPVDPRRGPWSLDLTLGSVPRWRLGSTNWARDVEDSGKRTRLAAVVDQRGGDRRFAEGLYKLIQSGIPPGRARAIGRAVELELGEGVPGTAEFYICVP